MTLHLNLDSNVIFDFYLFFIAIILFFTLIYNEVNEIIDNLYDKHYNERCSI